MADQPIRGGRPARNSPAGFAANGNAPDADRRDPTVARGGVPSDLFGMHQTYSTGARGSEPPGGREAPTDVTLQRGQIDPGLSMVEGKEITDTGADGSQGANTGAGGTTIRYTDVFAALGGGGAGEMTTRAHVDGSGDWTQANGDGYDAGPTLPILRNARPTSTGAGQGHSRTMHP